MWKLDHQESLAPKIWCFWTMVWEKTLRVLGIGRRSIQSILKEISPECSLEGLMLKLKLQYFGHLMWRTESLEKPWCWERLKAEREGDDRGWHGWMASKTWWTWVSPRFMSCWCTGKPGVQKSMGCKELTEWLNWRQSLAYFQGRKWSWGANHKWWRKVNSRIWLQAQREPRWICQWPETFHIPRANARRVLQRQRSAPVNIKKPPPRPKYIPSLSFLFV